MLGKVGLSYRVSLIEIDKDKFTKALKEACREVLLVAARKFLLAAVPRIPIFTGFTRGAFGPIEDIAGKVGRHGGTFKIRTKQTGFQKTRNFQEPRIYYYYHRNGIKVVRNTTNARQFVTKSKDIFGDARFVGNKTSIGFRFAIDLVYFPILDQKWKSMEYGINAFNSALRKGLQNLKIDIGKYTIKRELK